ncbi:MAG: Esa1p-associated factor [Vezdaea aestivalis]|nr:MAG: Esa1p-associated factor [Vezdaea aestivalis]
MAPSNQLYFAKDEKVLCFHHELLYEAKVLDARPQGSNDKKGPMQFRVHYKGWKNTWDDWVPQDRIRKFTEENIELSRNLRREMEALRTQNEKPKKPQGSLKKKTGAGSEFSSQRGSEERHSSVQTAGPRGQKRARDYDIEKFGASESASTPSSIRSEKDNGGSPVGPSSDKSSASTIIKSEPSSSKSPKAVTPPRSASKSSTSSPLSAARSISSPDFAGLNAILSDGSESPQAIPTKTSSSSNPETPRRKGPRIKYTSAKVTERVFKNRHVGDTYNVARRAFYADDFQGRKDMMIAGRSADKPREQPAKKTGKASKRKLSDSQEQEETFVNRPAIHIHVPDHLKALLVDDWENVTKNLQLAPLPSKTPVSMILRDYFQDEQRKRRPGSPEAEILEEVVDGIKEYFELALGRILLYRFEREQYAELRKTWMSSKGENASKTVGDIYGAEHLLRLFVNFPELIAQTNMDSQSVNKLKGELTIMTQWIATNWKKYLSQEYETATQDYIERARGN